MVPLLRDGLSWSETPERPGAVRLADESVARSVTLSAEEAAIVRLFDGTRALSAIAETLARQGLPVDEAALGGLVEQLGAAGLLEGVAPQARVPAALDDMSTRTAFGWSERVSVAETALARQEQAAQGLTPPSAPAAEPLAPAALLHVPLAVDATEMDALCAQGLANLLRGEVLAAGDIWRNALMLDPRREYLAAWLAVLETPPQPPRAPEALWAACLAATPDAATSLEDRLRRDTHSETDERLLAHLAEAPSEPAASVGGAKAVSATGGWLRGLVWLGAGAGLAAVVALLVWRLTPLEVSGVRLVAVAQPHYAAGRVDQLAPAEGQWVRAPIDGVIRRLTAAGESVSAAQTVAEIGTATEGRAVTLAREALAAARAKLAKLELKPAAARHNKKAAHGNARALAAAQGQVAAAQRRLGRALAAAEAKAKPVNVVAGRAGSVLEVAAALGQSIATNAPLLRIGERHVWRLRLRQVHPELWHTGDVVSLAIDADPSAARAPAEAAARVVGVAASSASLWVELRDPTGQYRLPNLPHGAFHLVRGAASLSLLVPKEALWRDAKGATNLWRVDDDGLLVDESVTVAREVAAGCWVTWPHLARDGVRVVTGAGPRPLASLHAGSVVSFVAATSGKS